ncbi:GTP 3',8-cyclase MoaA [Parapedobacter indicus]|uniref:GTP 3',8-cyclase n=1 Tax=Parapedobacter indicus TaxID=1477437 RepID=A0A1I3RVW1_9SPHI|nr:GTP 3',8-cyclase MoaA [Parapedobacter indicus]PPK99969.1 cyclic pyranopterin monophosphate synthase subunit MoaA [Parapedobacter indicus]SFJ50170.1 cyclic pyranopterin monophosphate synthase subunit MoaA [Parapedobacter indicus]
MITDNHGREINYLRLAVTDRCNLRCSYCMPAEGLDWLPRRELMTYEEMLRICSLFITMGVEKIRITGGEPLVRRDLVPFLYKLSEIGGLRELTLTTNGLLTGDFVSDFKEIGIKSVNLSLDTLDKDRFFQITRREGLNKVLETMDKLLENDISIKINTVVMANKNIADIIPLVRLTQHLPVSVRFIEEMPFNGGTHQVTLDWDHRHILDHIRKQFPAMEKLPDAPYSTSYNYHIPGYKGKIGVIAAYSRLFCGSCNRIRITSTGVLRTCLYETGSLNLKDAIREGCTDAELRKRITETVLKKPADGWEAQDTLMTQHREQESMATIGG